MEVDNSGLFFIHGQMSLGTLEEAALVAKDTVVCGFQQKENMEWCLVVWRAWGGSKLNVFFQSYEELYRSESNVRKRRFLKGLRGDR
ncbi:Leucine-rich repeat serine/threonine-protein kinase 1 [Ameca splendens]|uniref:Leucine-rich repeat serine/threonine-protein kinase 1 n=1 Tax=Ameca splendens TaxID=208324 RepID=A0ABV0XR62_9TELE